MTFDELAKTIKAVRFPRGRFMVRRADDRYFFEICFRFRSRDVLHPHKRVNALMISQRFPMRDLDIWEPSLALDMARRIIHQTIDHEVDEWISVNGERPFNPHARTI